MKGRGLLENSTIFKIHHQQPTFYINNSIIHCLVSPDDWLIYFLLYRFFQNLCSCSKPNATEKMINRELLLFLLRLLPKVRGEKSFHIGNQAKPTYNIINFPCLHCAYKGGFDGKINDLATEICPFFRCPSVFWEKNSWGGTK